MDKEEYLNTVLKVLELLEEYPEYIISELGEDLVASPNAPEDVKIFCEWENAKNRLIDEYYDRED